MAEKYYNYIGGEWVESSSGETFENINPANHDDVVGIFPLSTAEDVNRAVEAAKKAQKEWAALPVPERAKILGRAGDIMVERKEELARLETREMGKIMAETRGDVQEGIDTLYYAFGEGRRLFGITTPSELPNKIAYTTIRPVGIAGIITPWNFPMAIPCWKIIPALLLGNAVVFKPAHDTPATATELVKILIEAGVPEGVVNIVHGTGKVVGEAIVQHPDIGVISFTGSASIGAHIYSEAAKQLKKVSLEMGGKNPMIVMDDADLDLALEGALWGAFGTTGQRCTATSRLILHEKIHDKFLDMLIERAKQLKVGNAYEDETVDMGPIINEHQMNVILNYIEIGKKEGAELVLGGNRLTGGDYDKGWFIEPTIFVNVTPEMTIFREEIFGPVLAVTKVKDFDEAIEVANDCQYGLSSAIYTTDVRKAMKAVELLEAGITYVNAPTIGAECHLPFGGVKNTGNGHREGGKWVYEIFGEIKTVYIDYSGKLQKAQIDTDMNK